MTVLEGKSSKVTQILADAVGARPADVAKRLMPLVYDELRELAARYLRSERRGHTLQPTALVHEAFMRLVDQSRVDWKGRTHFCAVGAAAMRRILIDHARARGRGKRGGEWQRVVLEEADMPVDLRDIDLVALHDALESLAALDQKQARNRPPGVTSKPAMLSERRFVIQFFQCTRHWRLNDGELAQDGGSGSDHRNMAARLVSAADRPRDRHPPEPGLST